jgi:hypothetical protein
MWVKQLWRYKNPTDEELLSKKEWLHWLEGGLARSPKLLDRVLFLYLAEALRPTLLWAQEAAALTQDSFV